MNSDSDDSSDMCMATLETLENPIIDEYDRDVMEQLDNVADENPDDELVQDRIVWNHPSFSDISAWETYQPFDDNVRVHHPHSPDLRKGTTFAEKEDVILAVQKYSILNRVEYRVMKSDSTRLVLECRKGEQVCPWRLRVFVLQNTSYWMVRTHGGDHICHNNNILQNNIHLNAHFIAREMRNVMDANTRFSVGEIRNIIQRDYGYKISYWKAWKAQKKALVYLFGKWDESFNRLPHLMQALQDCSNNNNCVKWDVTTLENETVQVNRIFWSFAECILAFKHCRPIISVDGTHMYGKYNAKLLVAIGLDANNHILPLAFALVESENNSSWKWFMSCIREGVTQREGLCVVSDRHPGILAAMREPEWEEPKAFHRVCVRHLQGNFMTKVKDEVLKAKLGEVAYAKKELKFKRKFGELLQLLKDKPPVRKWLEDMNVERWTQAFDNGGYRWGNMTTNASECLNKILKNGRDLPVSSLVMYTFRQTSAYFVKRSQSQYNINGAICPPKISDRLAELRARAQFHIVTWFNPETHVFDVLTRKNHVTYRVCLTTRTCSCAKWTLFKYPCSHAMAACRYANIDDTVYVPKEYTLEAYYMTWSYFFNPLLYEDLWREYNGPDHVPNPRFRRNKGGRPPTRRRRTNMDQRCPHLGESSSQAPSTSTPTSRIQRCTHCQLVGHNKRACPTRYQN
ncbi:unnamed protein product [Rhodiola kirilowii]